MGWLVVVACLLAVCRAGAVASTQQHRAQQTNHHRRPLRASDLDPGFPPVWPHPAVFATGAGRFVVDPDLNFHVSGQGKDVLAALERFVERTFAHRVAPLASPPAVIDRVEVTVDTPDAELQMGIDESYTLRVNSSTTIHAPTQVGLYHALETLSQLIVFDAATQSYTVTLAWDIQDRPRFPHREILFDTGRHFQPLPSLKDVIDSVTFAKFNVIHWHLVDQQSFPAQFPSHPELARMGAFSPSERYTAEDIEDVVEYARQRGVRVMVEVDSPGHAAAMCASHPEVCPALNCRMPLNPATNATFDLLTDILRDMTGGKRGAGLFPSNVLHLGGDEVRTSCWNQSAAIRQWMADHDMDINGAYFYFVDRMHAVARGMEREVVGWEEIWTNFGTRLNPATIVHQWKSGSTVAQECTKAGYRALYSGADTWYLEKTDITWDTMYTAEPCNGIEDSLCDRLVLGGGGEMWGEEVDVSDILQTIWPRAAAIAERLWSPRDVNDTVAALPRLSAFRCLLNQRGVPAAPVRNPEARTGPSGPGSCYNQ